MEWAIRKSVELRYIGNRFRPWRHVGRRCFVNLIFGPVGVLGAVETKTLKPTNNEDAMRIFFVTFGLDQKVTFSFKHRI